MMTILTRKPSYTTNVTNARIYGFTLIELMVVVAVIGILSSIAIPQYQNYVKKSQLTAAVATLSALKINAEDYILTEGKFPTLSASDINSTLGATTSSLGTLEAKALTSSPLSGQLILTLNSNSLFDEKKIALSRETNGAWLCVTDIAAASFVPKYCSTKTIL